MGFSPGTQIEISNNSTKAIEDFQISDPLLVAEDINLKLWAQKPVSMAVQKPGRNKFIRIEFGDQKEFLASPDQLFLMDDKSLKRAEKLIPGVHSFVLKNGDRCPIILAQACSLNLDICDLGVSIRPTKSPGGNLYVANGIVVGDYALQIGV